MKKMPLSDRHTKTPDNHLIKKKGIKNEIRRNILVDKRRKENSNEDHRHIFDVAIIGAGFAGLSAALLLGRYLLPTVIFDGGKTRNFMTKQVHGYLGLENTTPKQFIQKAWRDVLQYESIKVIKTKVERVKREGPLFLLSTKEEDKRRTRRRILVKTNHVIIATGIKDVKPKVKNFETFDGNGAWHCPHCDGFQTTNKKLVIISSRNNDSIKYAKEFLGWTRNIQVFLQGDNYKLTSHEISEAKKLGIKVVENDEIIEIIGDRKKGIKGVICRSKKFHNADVIFYHLGYNVQNKLAEQLGCELDDGYIKIDNQQQTTIPNVYAAGDIDTDRHYIVLAAASGALAAISIYEKMLGEAITTVKAGHF
jgi:thioredoxin reductase